MCLCASREFGRWKVNSLAVEKRDGFGGSGGLALPLDPDFMHTVRLLGRRPTLHMITESLIKKYGTHLLLSATLGGTESTLSFKASLIPIASNVIFFFFCSSNIRGTDFTVCCVPSNRAQNIFIFWLSVFWLTKTSKCLLERTTKTDLILGAGERPWDALLHLQHIMCHPHWYDSPTLLQLQYVSEKSYNTRTKLQTQMSCSHFCLTISAAACRCVACIASPALNSPWSTYSGTRVICVLPTHSIQEPQNPP